jgi:hypothetical protein
MRASGLEEKSGSSNTGEEVPKYRTNTLGTVELNELMDS